jgi:hypothetical protein
VPNLPRLGTNAVTTQQHYQREKSRIAGFCRVGLSGFDCRINGTFIDLANPPH